MPWGISESAYDVVDHHGNYQYKAFGVPGLGMKRGLADELVAPYATALAALVTQPRRRRTSAASRGRCSARTASSTPTTRRGDGEPRGDGPGPPARPGRDRARVPRPSPGMTLAAIAGALTGNRMVERFHSDPRVQATELLLQERVPRHAALIRPRRTRRRASAPVPPAAVRRLLAAPRSRTRSSCRTATTPSS